jgi:hypothetical protein
MLVEVLETSESECRLKYDMYKRLNVATFPSLDEMTLYYLL